MVATNIPFIALELGDASASLDLVDGGGCGGFADPRANAAADSMCLIAWPIVFTQHDLCFRAKIWSSMRGGMRRLTLCPKKLWRWPQLHAMRWLQRGLRTELRNERSMRDVIRSREAVMFKSSAWSIVLANDFLCKSRIRKSAEDAARHHHGPGYGHGPDRGGA